jgi:N-acetylmuramic acid 6-phosphate etherase
MEEFIKITEQPSHYNHLEEMTVNELLSNINKEDETIADVVKKAIPQIEKLVETIVDKMLAGGRLFYIGAGTSGRLAVVDASECVPTFGVEKGLVNAIIAGGKKAFTEAVEFAEDSETQGWLDLQQHHISQNDIVIGLSASGTTPYVISAIKNCSENNIVTACITCNARTPLSEICDYPVEVVTGPEFITGSTRMKAGTAQKLVLNMISTSVMIKLGNIEDNKMVNMQLTNEKLIDRGTKMLMEALKISDHKTAKKLLLKHGSVKNAIIKFS